MNPNEVSHKNGNIFGLPHTRDEAEIILIPSIIDTTVSYGDGTAQGPSQIVEASYQIDLFEPTNIDLYKKGIFMYPVKEEEIELNRQFREKAAYLIEKLENGEAFTNDDIQIQNEINAFCDNHREKIKTHVLYEIESAKKVGMIGGDHSSSLGALQAFAHEYESFGVLQIDAHADLRDAYEGFAFSHASVMYEALKIPQITKLVQVGIRDICHDEVNLIDAHPDRIHTFFDRDIKHHSYKGTSWHQTCLKIIQTLPEFVYVSFDIDGLDPKLCPNTGTPVPGGLEFEQACYLIQQIKESGRKIIGFDVVEVSNGPDSDWDANVGMRLIYRICALL